MQKKPDEAWAARNPDLPYKTPYEALIMASIVEKETGAEGRAADDRRRVRQPPAQGMMLQTDPTVIYGMGERYDGKIPSATCRPTRPTTPIPCRPAADADRAAGHAALPRRCRRRDRCAVFRRPGDGTSQFTGNLNEHNRAVNKFQR
jgi:UPF0755 protein